jgi:hypothetical protein
VSEHPDPQFCDHEWTDGDNGPHAGPHRCSRPLDHARDHLCGWCGVETANGYLALALGLALATAGPAIALLVLAVRWLGP